MKKLSILFLLIPGLASAQQASFIDQYQWEIIIGLMILVGVVTVLALVVAWAGLSAIVKERRKEQGLETEAVLIKAQEGEEHVGFWGRFWNRFNSAVPVAMEQNVETSHEYDGIRELDNRLPPWWLYGFYFTIAFGIVYLLRYEVLGTGMSQHEEYVAKMKEADAEVQAYLASIQSEEGEIVIELLTDETALAAGQNTFKVNCAQCHASDGGGLQALGPNLTDKYWKNGGDFESIVNIIKSGVSGTSMIPWETQLRPAQISEVASFIWSLEGTTPANPKAPEGEPYEREEVQEEGEVTSDSTAVASEQNE